MRKKDGYGSFGNLSGIYNRSRSGIPKELLEHLFALTQKENPTILDVGCGTGIVSRQLQQSGARVYATDIDKRMVAVAKKRDSDNEIQYSVAPTEKLPFFDGTFDAVTAFSAFHWFANTYAVSEMHRVLRKSGIIFVINKNQKGNMRKEYLKLLHSFTNVKNDLPNAKAQYDPKKLLTQGGFKNVKESFHLCVEKQEVGKVISYVQTTSLWNLVPEKNKGQALKELRDFFEAYAIKGMVERPIEYQVVFGNK